MDPNAEIYSKLLPYSYAAANPNAVDTRRPTFNYPYSQAVEEKYLADEVTRFLKGFDTGFDAMTLPEKKAAIRRIVDTIIVYRKERCLFEAPVLVGSVQQSRNKHFYAGCSW